MKKTLLIGAFLVVSVAWAFNATFSDIKMAANVTFPEIKKAPPISGIKVDTKIDYYKEVFGEQRPSIWITHGIFKWMDHKVNTVAQWVEYPEVGVLIIDFFLLFVRIALVACSIALAILTVILPLATLLFLGIIEEFIVLIYFFVRPFSGVPQVMVTMIELYFWFLVELIIGSRDNIPTQN